MAEKALTAVNQEACIQDISTRSVDDLVKAMSITGISKRQVSRLRQLESYSATSQASLSPGAWPRRHSGDRDDAFFGSDQTGGAAIIAARVSSIHPVSFIT